MQLTRMAIISWQFEYPDALEFEMRAKLEAVQASWKHGPKRNYKAFM